MIGNLPRRLTTLERALAGAGSNRPSAPFAVIYGVPGPGSWRCRHWTAAEGHTYHEGEGAWVCDGGARPKTYGAIDGADPFDLL
jgi:hypothetical protein